MSTSARTLVIGDIHGCHAEFLALLEAAGIGPADRILGIGDLLDRGPESPQVLEFFLSRPNAGSVMGNHEWKHVQGADGEALQRTRQACGPDLYTRGLTWMRTLPFYLELPEAILVHWGLEPGVPLERQHPAVMTGEPAGEMCLREECGPRQWYEAYEGLKPVIYGHHAWAAGERRGLTYGIDTGCVFGGRLTGIVLPEFRIVSVPSRGRHWPDENGRSENEKAGDRKFG